MPKNIEESENEYDSEEYSENENYNKRKREGLKYIDEEAEEDDLDEDDDEPINAKEKSEYLELKEKMKYKTHGNILQKTVATMEERYTKQQYPSTKKEEVEVYDGGEDYVDAPVGVQMPSVLDPKLWMIWVKPGKEREVASSILLKYFDLKNSENRLMITSVISSNKLSGNVYIESRKEQYVMEAIKEMHFVYRKKPLLVPIKEMVSVMNLDKAKLADIRTEQWVRVNRGLYKGDLAQIHSIEEHRTKITIKIIPRIDLTSDFDDDDNDRMNKNYTTRPEQRLFNKNDIDQSHLERQNYNGERYYLHKSKRYKDGLLYKTVNVKILVLDDIQATHEEIKLFSSVKDEDGKEVYTEEQIISAINEKYSDKYKYLQYERVLIVHGECKGLIGVVQSCRPDGSSVKIKPTNVKDFEDEIEIDSASVVKKFEVGDNVVITEGHYKGMVGMVMHVDEYLVEVLSSDKSKRVKARIRNVLLSNSKYTSYILSEDNQHKKYSIHSLILFKGKDDSHRNEAGVITKVEKNYLRVLINENYVEDIAYNLIVQQFPKNKQFSATDKNTNSLKVGDSVKVLEGFFRGSQGSIKHIYKNIVWLVCSNQEDNLGYIAINSKRLIKSGYGQIQGHFFETPRTRQQDKLSNFIIIKKGQYKSHKARINKSLGNTFVVELLTRPKVITLHEGDFARLEFAELENTMPSADTQAFKTPAYIPNSVNTLQTPQGNCTPYGDNPFRNNASGTNSPQRSSFYDHTSNHNNFTPNDPYNFSPSRDSKHETDR